MGQKRAEYDTDLQRDNLDPELFAAALAVQHLRKLLSNGGCEYGGSGDEEALQPGQIEAFLVRTIEMAKKTKRFQQEWCSFQQLLPLIKHACPCCQACFQDDLLRASTNREEIEYLSLFDFALDCYAYVAARNAYPDNGILQAWIING